MLNMPINTLTHAHKDHNCKVSSSNSLVAQRVKNLPAMAGDLGLIPGGERSPGEGNVYPLQHCSLKNSMDKTAWQTTSMGLQRVGHD